MADTDFTYPDEAFRSWEQQRSYYEKSFAGIVGVVIEAELPNRPLVLDAAAGEGYGAYLLELARVDATVISTDLDRASLSNDRWLPADDNAPRVVSRADTLPFSDDAFDGVLSISGIHTIDADTFPDIIGEVHRVLRPGGKLLLTNDTPRGLDYIFNDPFLMESIQPKQNETVVATYDDNGDICEPVVIERVALDEALKTICTKLGVTPAISAGDYQELMQIPDGEFAFINLFAQAANLALALKQGYRPFEYNSNGGSWNKYFYANLVDDISNSPVRFNQTTRRSIATTEAHPMVVNMPNGSGLHVSRFQRDTVGNLYVAEYSQVPVEAPIVNLAISFLVAQKI